METKLNVKLLSHTMNPELVIATSGKLCYSPSNIGDLMEKQTDESINRFVNMLVSCGHESPLEHVSFTFAIEGVSRSLTHQLVRHRIASYSQQSQRYVRENQFEYIIPKDIKKNRLLSEIYIDHMEESQKKYDRIVGELIFDYIFNKEYKNYIKVQLKKCNIEYSEFSNFINENTCEVYDDFINKLTSKYKKLYSILEKRAIENARYVFPNATETKIICTMNLRTLINFCKHRCCRRAQDEIHDLAWKIVHIIEEVSPLLGKTLGASCQFSRCPEGDMCCGVPYPKKNK